MISDNTLKGPGIWKWLHYFEIYDQYLSKFRGLDLVMVEVGIYSGGSLGMWKSYFGINHLTLHGIDIEPDCRVYEQDGVVIHIGDQENRVFWKEFLQKVPIIDVFLDDGGHTPAQQIVTFEEVFPSLSPGGVYICEDIHGAHNGFFHYISAFIDQLHHSDKLGESVNPIQATVKAVHVFPYMVVVEKASSRQTSLTTKRRGTEWQPFLK